MAEKFRDIVPELRPFVPRSLLDCQGWERLLDRVGGLPGWPTAASVGFEFRLVGDARADLAVAVRRDSHLLDYYVDQGKGAGPDSAAAALAGFFTRLADTETSAESRHSDWFESAMLEYDVAGALPGQPADPGLFIRLVHGGPDWPAKRLPAPGVLAAALASAVGWTEDESEVRAVERVFATLPPGGKVGQIGAMPGRELRAIRLIVDGVEAEEVPDCLGRLGWPGQAAKAMAVLADMRDITPQFRLSLDISVDGMSPRLGLELYPPVDLEGKDQWLTTGRSTWRPVVDRLEALRWCQPDKARGLLDFPGLDKLFDEKGVLLLYRGINHVKVTIEADDLQAKAYAGLRFFRLSKEVKR
ncbi:MAG: hypothetical protein OXE86_20495 [Alphaproteobacteria bacterium]|nr:hypothetical protein [Alphaproteobacteria bacterium]